MSKDINLKEIKEKSSELVSRLSRHFSFVAALFILTVFIITVWRISQLASAEPTADQQGTAEVVNVPKVDQNAINQVLKLENNSPQVHSLFNAARNNPFGE